MSKHNPEQEKESLSTDIRLRRSFAPTVPKPTTRLGRVVANHYVKIAGAACFAILIFVQLSNIGSTISYFTDVENSLGNFFVADPVYFTVEASSTSPIILGSEPTLIVSTMTPGEYSDLVQYQVTASTTGGDPALCNAIQVLTTSPFPYDGLLAGLTTGLTTDTGPWALHVSVPPDMQVTSDTSCTVDLVYQGWNASSTPGQGYTDIQKVSLKLFLSATPVAPSAPTVPDPSVTLPPDEARTTPADTPPADATTTDATTTPDTIQTVPTPDATPPADAPPADITPPIDTPPTPEPQQ